LTSENTSDDILNVRVPLTLCFDNSRERHSNCEGRERIPGSLG
jgi:hypothetical protein